jgi:hypothetical protein
MIFIRKNNSPAFILKWWRQARRNLFAGWRSASSEFCGERSCLGSPGVDRQPTAGAQQAVDCVENHCASRWPGRENAAADEWARFQAAGAPLNTPAGTEGAPLAFDGLLRAFSCPAFAWCSEKHFGLRALARRFYSRSSQRAPTRRRPLLWIRSAVPERALDAEECLSTAHMADREHSNRSVGSPAGRLRLADVSADTPPRADPRQGREPKGFRRSPSLNAVEHGVTMFTVRFRCSRETDFRIPTLARHRGACRLAAGGGG